MKYRKHFATVSLLVAVVSVVVYFLLDAIYRLPEAASAEAGPIDLLMNGHFMVIAFLWSLVVVFVVYSLVVFRQRPGDEESDGDYFHGHTGLEVAWTILPLIIVIFFAVWGAQALNEITRVEPEREMIVQVIGQQWSWSFVYPEHGDFVSTDLVLPVNQKVLLEMESRDVLHSFWVPEFRVKQDLVPGQLTYLRVTPTVVNDYKVRCAEICGTLHHSMLAPVRVLSQGDFDAWVAQRAGAGGLDLAAASPAERGETWAQQFGCTACHSQDGVAGVGPTWLGVYGSERPLEDGGTVVADEEYLRTAILEPDVHIVEGFARGIMPQNFGEQFAAEEARYDGEFSILADLIAFIESLSE